VEDSTEVLFLAEEYSAGTAANGNILTLQGYDIQKLEDQIFGEEVEYDVLSNTNRFMNYPITQ
jgi:hypothetical protein